MRIDTIVTVTLATRFTLRSQRLNSSSRLERKQVSGGKQVKIYYRNDPVKYDLNLNQFSTLINTFRRI